MSILRRAGDEARCDVPLCGAGVGPTPYIQLPPKSPVYGAQRKRSKRDVRLLLEQKEVREMPLRGETERRTHRMFTRISSFTMPFLLLLLASARVATAQ